MDVANHTQSRHLEILQMHTTVRTTHLTEYPEDPLRGRAK